MSLQDFISVYGYLAIATGTFLEGETILILGGFAAHRGYLELPWVIAAAFTGTLCGDQLYFFLGRLKGKGMVERRPGWKARSVKVYALLEKHQILLILGFRFLYGLRTVTPFIIGASNIPAARFIVLNILGALLWAITVGYLGFLFGHSLELMIDQLKHYELLVFAAIILTAGLLWAIRAVHSHKAGKS